MQCLRPGEAAVWSTEAEAEDGLPEDRAEVHGGTSRPVMLSGDVMPETSVLTS
jgi:hypothetical protein